MYLQIFSLDFTNESTNKDSLRGNGLKFLPLFCSFSFVTHDLNNRRPVLTGLQDSSVSTLSADSSGRHSRASKYNHCWIGVNFPLQACK